MGFHINPKFSEGWILVLTIAQKLDVFNSYKELEKKVEKDQVRIDYSFTDSKIKQKNVICQFSLKTGNGYVCGRYLQSVHQYKIDPRGWINIKNFNETDLREVITESIKSLSK